MPRHVGARVGRYTIVRLLGAGGRGVVYEALQDEPRRRVALKVVASNAHDSDRLRYEAEILGRLQHASVAMVHESGHDAEFGAFIAMELVDGARHLDEFVRGESLSIRDIVRLHAEVCAAVAHGHAHGVVHRDLKPSNILVDAHGRPKVIDFGIARALDAQRTGTTGSGQFSGTLAYTSPEQVGAGAIGLDVRSDVYALGVVLYELIAGRPPLELDGVSLDEAARRIREDRPARLRSVRADVDAELEWIVAKALEKDPQRRYASAPFLADDLRRYLAHEEVSASPPTTSYRLRVFARRNRIALVVAAAIVALLATGSIAAWRDRARALELAARADEAEKRAAARGDELARELAVNQEILDAQAAWFRTAGSERSGPEARWVDVLDRASRTLDAAPAIDADVEVELRYALSVAYNLIDLWAPSREQALGARAAIDRGGVLTAARRDHLALIEVQSLFLSGAVLDAHAMAAARVESERARAGGPDAGALGRALGSLASIEVSLSEFETADIHVREAVTLLAPLGTEAAREPRQTRIRILTIQRSVATAAAEARALCADLRAEPSTRRGALLQCELLLGMTLTAAGETRAALEILTQVRSEWEALYGPDSQNLCDIDRAMADACAKLGQPARALELARRSRDGYARLFGPDHHYAREMRSRLALYSIAAGNVAEGVELFETLLVEGERDNGLHSVAQLRLEHTYATALTSKGVKLDRALELLEGAMARGRTVYAREPVQLVVIRHQLSTILQLRGEFARARELYQENLSVLEVHKGRYDRETFSTIRALGQTAQRLGFGEEAECWWRDVHGRRVELDGTAPAAWSDADGLGDALVRNGNDAEADRLAAVAITIHQRAPRPDHMKICRLLLVRAQAAARLYEPARARQAFAATLEYAWTNLAESSVGRAFVESAYATFLVSQSDFDGALSLADIALDRRNAPSAPRREAALAAAAAHAFAGRADRASEMRAIADGIPE